MNQRLQALLNPPHMEVPEISRFPNDRQGLVFRHGDRVIQMINNYEREVFNGDSGFIVGVDPLSRSLTVEYPETDYVSIQEGRPLNHCCVVRWRFYSYLRSVSVSSSMP